MRDARACLIICELYTRGLVKAFLSSIEYRRRFGL